MKFTCTIYVVAADDDHYPYSPSYRCQHYCCMMIRIASIIQRQAGVLQPMTMMSVMAFVVVVSPEVASDSFDRKRSMDFVHWTDPFPQITLTFFFSVYFLLDFLYYTIFVAWIRFFTWTLVFFILSNTFKLFVGCVFFFLYAVFFPLRVNFFGYWFWLFLFFIARWSITFPILYLRKLPVLTGTNW